MSRHVTILTADDWEMLFLNQVLIAQGSEIQVADLNLLCPFDSIEQREMPFDAQRALAQVGRLPDGATLTEALNLSTEDLFDEDS